MPVSHCCDYCSFVVIFEIKKCEFFNIVLFSVLFGHSGSMEIPYAFEDQLCQFLQKKAVGILIRIALNLYITLGSIAVLTMLSLCDV